MPNAIAGLLDLRRSIDARIDNVIEDCVRGAITVEDIEKLESSISYNAEQKLNFVKADIRKSLEEKSGK